MERVPVVPQNEGDVMEAAVTWETWEPVYDAIREDFGYDRVADEAARDDVLQVGDTWCALESLPSLQGTTVAIVGGASPQDGDTEKLAQADAIVAAGDGARVVSEAGRSVSILVTDLDSTRHIPRTLTKQGTPVAVHAHGDNRELIASEVPKLETRWVLPTTQVEPQGPVVNLGGFTDGDRAAFLAHARGAEQLVFPGWDFDDPGVSETKRQKLAWAERLLLWLEEFREERFALLDGRRTGIAPLP